MILAILMAAASFEEGLQLKKQEKFAQAEAVFAELLREKPDDLPALMQWATLLGWLGRFDDSIGAWRRALDLRPPAKDALDCRIALSRVQYWKGDLPQSRGRLEQVVEEAPRELDALVLLGDVCTAQHDPACARSAYQRARALDPGNPELGKKLARTAAPVRGRLDAGGTVDGYDTARGTEGSFFAQGSWQVTAPLVLSAGYEQLHQFSQVDHRLNLTAYLNPTSALQLGARVAVSPGAHTIANWDAAVSAEQRLASFVSALVTVRHLDFSDNGVTIVGPGVRLGYAAFSLLLSGGPVFSTVFSTQAFGQGRLEWAATDALALYAGYSRGGEAQHVAGAAALPAGAPTTEIRTTSDLTAGSLWQIDRAFGLRLDYTHEHRQSTYTRNSLGSALTWRF